MSKLKAVLLASALALPTAAQAQEKKLKIGVIYDYSGPFAGGGSELHALGAKIIIDHFIKKGGVEGYQIEAAHIDLVPMIRDAVLLAAPLNPLHDPNCKGLCAECGQDLNVADCGHRPERINLAWEPLKRLREQMGE